MSPPEVFSSNTKLLFVLWTHFFINNAFTYDEKTKIISDIYQTTLSKIEPRIVVSGKNEYLTKHDISSRIRTALFAGVRCVYLYQQYGGNKIKFFLFKKNYTEMLKEIIKTKLN